MTVHEYFSPPELLGRLPLTHLCLPRASMGHHQHKRHTNVEGFVKNKGIGESALVNSSNTRVSLSTAFVTSRNVNGIVMREPSNQALCTCSSPNEFEVYKDRGPLCTKLQPVFFPPTGIDFLSIQPT
jgi:hypothetical protein